MAFTPFSPLSSAPSPGTLSANEIRLHLQRMIPVLAEFGIKEEEQFVRIGTQLGDFLRRSRIISSYSNEVIDSLLQKEGDEVLAGLQLLLNDLEHHIAVLSDDARLHHQSLQRVSKQIHQIGAPLQALIKVIKILHSLSFSTKVESTQGDSVVVLQALAADLQGLAIKIHGKTDTVRERLKRMLELAQGATEKTRLMSEVTLRQAGGHLQQCRNLLDLIAARRTATLDDARELQDYFDDISHAISEIISSVQFHDITRQQVEHVQSALHYFCERMLRADAEDQMALEVANLCRVQSAQLRHTRQDLSAAVGRIIGSLRSIAPAVQHLAHKTRCLSTMTEAVGASLFRDVEPVLTTVTGIIATADQEDRQVLAAVAEVLAVLGELSELLQEVESIGTEMKMISFNAGITAAHNHERGAGLGVIASTIQSLSSEVLTRTGEFAAIYRTMEQLAQEMNSGTRSALSPESSGSEHLSAVAAGFVTRLQAMNQSGLQLMTKLDGEVLALAVEVVATAEKITIHVEAGRMIDLLLAEFDSLAGRVHFASGFGGEAKVLDLIARNYTMQSERRVHNDVRQRTVASEADPLAAAPPGQDRTGLGANVELF